MNYACSAATCVDAATAAWLFGLPMTCFAAGYGIGRILNLLSRMYDAS